MEKDLVRLKHMLESAEAVLSFAKNKKRTDLDKDRLFLFGVLRALEVLGEAAGQVSKKTQAQFPDVPWKQLIGMRNRLIHAYFDIDHDRIWKTIKDYIPPFALQLKEIISELLSQ